MGEWGAVKCRLSSRPRSLLSIFGVGFVVGQLRGFVRVSRPEKVPKYYVSCRHACVAPSLVSPTQIGVHFLRGRTGLLIASAYDAEESYKRGKWEEEAKRVQQG